MVKISVLMPAYNSEQYIAEAIESILHQSYTDFEFIIINDGSSDNTANIVRKFAQQDKRIRFIDNKNNQGLICTLNQGLELCCGEYIARMDSDDISLPDRFAKQVNYLDKNPDVGVLGTAAQNFGANSDICYNSEIIDAMTLLRGVTFYHPSIMMRRSILASHNISYNKDFYLVEDYELWTQLLKFTKLRNLQEILLKYRVHALSVSVKNKELQEQNKQLVRQNILNYISSSQITQNEILQMAGLSPQTRKCTTFWLFNIFPLFKIAHKSPHKTKILLFNFLPVLKIKNMKVYFLGIIIGNIRFFNKKGEPR